MADEPQNTALQDSEQGDSDNTGDFSAFGIGGDSQSQPTAQTSPQASPSAAPAPSPIQVDTKQKVHPHMAILAGLLKQALGGIRNAPGNPNNAFDRGFMNASPNNQAMQQAAVSKAQSAADLEKMQVSVTGLKALQLEYLIKRLPQEQQEQHLKAVSDFKQNLIKEGATLEAEGDDEKASDTQAVHMNSTDPRATSHSGRFYSLPTMDSSGKAKFDVVYVPNKDTLQSDFKWTDPDGNEQTIPAGTPFSGAMGKFVETMQKNAQNQTKDQHKQMGDALKPNIPENEINQTVNWLEAQAKQNTPLYQQNKAAVDAQIQSLRSAQKETQQQKLQQAAATREEKTADDAVYAFDPESKSYELTTRKSAGNRETFKQTPEFDKALSRAQRIQDVSNKILDYRDTFAHGLTTNEKHSIENFLSDHPAMVTGPGVGDFKLQIGAQGAGLDEAARDLDMRQMPKGAKDRLNAFILAKTTALEMQRIETDSARMSTGGMQLDLGAIARPSDDPDTAIQKIDKFMRSVKTFGKVRVKGIPSAEEIEKDRPFNMKQWEEETKKAAKKAGLD